MRPTLATGAAAPDLEPGEVHVRWAALDVPPDAFLAARSLLSPEELKRASGLLSPRVRRRWIVARATLRRVLAGYVGTPAERLAFRRDRRGRPALRETPRLRTGPRLVFSLAHSRDLVLIAVGRVPRLGVDVELVRPLPALGPLARRALTPAEREAIAALPAPDRPRALLVRWVRKEAYLKALGVGLRADPSRLDGGIDGRIGGGYVLRGRRREGGWLLRELEPEPGYVAALAIRDPGVRVRARRWEGWETAG